jgi:hypothetical protein
MTLATHQGNLKYWFVPPGQPDPKEVLYPLDGRQQVVDSNIDVRRLTILNQQDAFAILQPLALDALSMFEFRRMAGGLGLSNLNNREDSQVLNYLAQQLLIGRLFVIRRVIFHSGGSYDEDQAATKRPEASGATVRSEKTAEPDPPTFAPEALQDQQAGSLMAASAEGVPFCEECARRAAQKAA